MTAPPSGIVIDYDIARKALGSLEIESYRGGAIVPWALSDEQDEMLRLLCHEPSALAEHPDAEPGWQFFVKGRRIGASLLTDGYDVLFTSLHDASGYVVRTALIWDVEDKAIKHLNICEEFCKQWRLPHRKRTKYIEFPNGSKIQVVPARTRASARGEGFHRYHISELPFWTNARRTWDSIQGALQGGAQCTIETTMALDDPLAAEEWARENAFAKVFFAIERHREYRKDASRLSAQDEAWLREEGFTNREAMAWWLAKMRKSYRGDPIACFKDFPQMPHHPMQTAKGRWFRAVPRVLNPLFTTSVRGEANIFWLVEWFQHPEDTSGSFFIGVDTAEGTGNDRSAVALVDRKTKRIVASFANEYILRDDLARVAMHVWGEVADHKIRRGAHMPTMYVETNGPGKFTYDEIAALGGSPTRVITRNDSDTYNALVATRRALEGGHAYGPELLLTEANQLHRTVNDKGRVSGWRGSKDLSMALGWCYLAIEQDVPAGTRLDDSRPAEDTYRAKVRRDYRKSLRDARGGL